MRLMSFALTWPQILDGSKTVTRRLGWQSLMQGDLIRPARKVRGVRREDREEGPALFVERVNILPLDAITQDDVRREGFPDMTPAEFVAMFCRHMRCTPSTMVTRIEFRRFDGA